MAAACKLPPDRLLPHSPTPTRVAAYAFLYQLATSATADGVRASERRVRVREAGERTKEGSRSLGRSMQRQHFVSEEEPGRAPVEEKKLKRPVTESSGHEETGAGDDEELPPRTRRKMKDTEQKPRPSGSTQASSASSVRAVLQDFLEQQQRLDAQRHDAAARHAQERLAFERQWRQEMQRLERERLMLEQAWREREEQRRIREEARADRRDALLTNLLNRLLHDNF
ncbi:unnamed protein product [Alopecurus aequalis]